MPLFSEHTARSLEAAQATFEHDHTFEVLPEKTRKIYFVGSGSSYSQAIYGAQLVNRYLPYPAEYWNPYSFVRYAQVQADDVVVHLSQEAKRNDNRCPLGFGTRQGARTILFASKTTELSELASEVYWFASETEKILVASMSYVSGYAALLKWVYRQAEALEITTPTLNLKEVYIAMQTRLTQSFEVPPQFTCFLYSHPAQSVAVEGALKFNECLLLDSESYELKHYSHGKHFVSYNKPRTYVVLTHELDRDLVDLYAGTIFEKHHWVVSLESSLPIDLAPLEWACGMLKFTVDGMRAIDLKLTDIPVRDKIRVPHTFRY